MLVNFKVLGEISVSGEHQRILRALRKCGTQVFLLLPPKGVPDCIQKSPASVTPNKSYTRFRFGEPTQEKPAPKLSSPILVTLVSPCCPSLTSIRLHLQPGQISVVQMWLPRHRHLLAPSPFFVAPLSSRHGRAFRLLTNPALFCSPKRSSVPLPVGCSFASPVLVAYFPHWPWTSIHSVLVSSCNSFPQPRPWNVSTTAPSWISVSFAMTITIFLN